MKFVRVGAAVGAVAIIVTACSGTSTSSSGAAAGGTPIKLGIELPMTGGEAPNGVPTANGVALALEQTQGRTGYNITINQQDDAVNGKHNADQGAKNMQTLANDPEVAVRRRSLQHQRRSGRDPCHQRSGPDAVQPGQHGGPADEAVGQCQADGLATDQSRQDRIRPRRGHR